MFGLVLRRFWSYNIRIGGAMVKKRYTSLGVFVPVAVAVGTSIITAQAPANPAHSHIGHVMTSWKDTPDAKGFLPSAIADVQVALEEVERADLEGRITISCSMAGMCRTRSILAQKRKVC